MDERLQWVFQTATDHACDTGEADHEVGDLQEIIELLWESMTSEQRDKAYADLKEKFAYLEEVSD